VSARPEGEEPVEGARNPEDGTCRVRQTRVMQISPPMSLEGRETPGGATRSTQDRGGHFGPNPERETKPRELPGGLRIVRCAERRKTSRSWKRRGGCGEPMSPLRRTERSGRPVNPERVVRGTATFPRHSRREIRHDSLKVKP
jgi:hypothetical protein